MQQYFMNLLLAAVLVVLTGCEVTRPVLFNPAVNAKALFDHPAQVKQVCATCHQGELPKGKVGSPLFDHAANNATGECSQCHLQKAQAKGFKDWIQTGDGFKHGELNECQSCHSIESPSTPKGPTLFDHQKDPGNGDCKACHEVRVRAGNFTSWRDTGLVDHLSFKDPAQDCTSCHKAEVPSNPKPDNQQNSIYVHSSKYSTEDCGACHGQVKDNYPWVQAYDTDAVPAPSLQPDKISWKNGVYSHLMGAKTVDTCTECHTSNYTPEIHPFSQRDGFRLHIDQPCVNCHGWD